MEEGHHRLYPSSRGRLESGGLPTQEFAALRCLWPPHWGGGSNHLNGDITCGDLPKLIHIILIDSPHTGLSGSLGNLQGSQCGDDGIERGHL